MHRNKLCVAAVAGLMVAGSTYAQSTLGEILDKGAKKMSREDFAAMLPAAVTVLWSSGSGETRNVYKADGTFSGQARHLMDPSARTSSNGTWTVDSSGKFCVDERLSGWGTQNQSCFFRFKAGDEFFDSPSDTDRTAKIMKRTVSR